MTQSPYQIHFLMAIPLCLPTIQLIRHGVVGLFYKYSLPIKTRKDLSFNASIVVELNFGRGMIFSTVLYRLRLNSQISYQILPIYIPKSKMKTYLQLSFLETSMVIHRFGGREIENLLSSPGLSQLISEPNIL